MSNLTKNKCLVCKTIYKKRTSTQKYCSQACNAKAYRRRNPETVKQTKQKYFANNKEIHNERTRLWYAKNIEKMAKYRKSRCEINRKYWKERREFDSQFRIKNNFRNRFRDLLQKNRKSSSVLIYVGCTFEKLVLHLESKFQSDMAWDNYGEWHYSNLQPLWAKDDLKKGGKYEQS